MKVFELQELQTATESFSPARLIGKGSHGSVYRGVLKDGSQVAVKKQSSALGDDTKLENEARILSTLHPNNHPCIIQFLGATDHHRNAAEKVIVTEYMPNATLHETLHPSNFSNISTAASPPLQWRARMEVAIRVASGVRFLHEADPPVVHRDIKPANILFDRSWNAKLADFGLAMRLLQNEEKEKEEDKLPAGTMGYIDPSYTTPSEVSTKVDVYSYGVVLLGLISGRKAIDMDKSPAAIVEWALPLIARGRAMDICDVRVQWPRFAGPKIEQLLRVAARCLSPEQSSRPTMSEIVVSLENLTVEPVNRAPPLSMNSIYDMVLSMMRRRKSSMFSTKVVTSGGACGNDDDDDKGRSGGGGNNICKGTLLVREILADITLK